MSLRTTVAAPFKWKGSRTLEESEIVVALSLDRNWFSPDQAKQVVSRAIERGLLERTGQGLVASFDVESVEIPDGFAPDDAVLAEASTFDRLLETIVAAGPEKRTAVAAINRLQRDLGLTIEAAAVVYARREGVDVTNCLDDVRETLRTR